MRIASATHSVLYESVTITAHPGGAIAVLDGYLCGVAAFAVLSGITRRRRWRGLYAAAVMVYLIGTLAGAQATMLALAIS